MSGLTPASLACFQKSYAPNTLPWSVIANAGMPIRAVSLNKSFSRAAPSSIEYSVCTCRCTNESLTGVSRSQVGLVARARGKAADVLVLCNRLPRHFRRVGRGVSRPGHTQIHERDHLRQLCQARAHSPTHVDHVRE